MSKTYILHNSNDEKLKKLLKKNCPMNNQVTYPFFMLNEFIDFAESIRTFSIFFLRMSFIHFTF